MSDDRGRPGERLTGRGPGPLALAGSGEYTPAMLDVERGLLVGRPPRYVQIPTAAGREGPKRLSYWVELGKAQAARLGVEAVPLVVLDREQADDPAVAAAVDGAGLIYLSGGSPTVLADTLRDTALWHAIVAAWQQGAALAGCSAGAMAFGDRVPELRNPAAGSRAGLGLLPQLRVLPHFDRMAGWIPDVLTRPFFRNTDGVTLIGDRRGHRDCRRSGRVHRAGAAVRVDPRQRTAAGVPGRVVDTPAGAAVGVTPSPCLLPVCSPGTPRRPGRSVRPPQARGTLTPMIDDFAKSTCTAICERFARRCSGSSTGSPSTTSAAP